MITSGRRFVFGNNLFSFENFIIDKTDSVKRFSGSKIRKPFERISLKFPDCYTCYTQVALRFKRPLAKSKERFALLFERQKEPGFISVVGFKRAFDEEPSLEGILRTF